MADFIVLLKDDPFEYLCFDCGQLRLSLKHDLTQCGNCGSTNIRKGVPGTLSKDMLKDGND